MPQAPKIVHLDELESIPGPGTLTWRPVRLPLDIRAFGCNAYSADTVGDDVVEPHTEEPSGHQELYFVARGRATFTIDGQTYDAPAGTYVFVPDPRSERHAAAAEAGTTVLSFGGPPTFEPSPWEWSFQAAPLFDSDPAGAREILIEGLEAWPDIGWLHYELARLAAKQGRRDETIESLRTAVRLDPDTARAAREHQDFGSLRGDHELQQLIGGAQSAG